MSSSVILPTIKRDLTWVSSHVVLLLVVAGIVGGAVYFVDNVIEKHDAANNQKIEQILSDQAAQTKSLQQQLVADQAANAQRDAAYQKTISQLSQSIAQRNINAQKQQTVDASLDASAAAARIAQQTQASPGQVTVSGNQVDLDLPVARSVVSGLDNGPVLQGNLADTQKELAAQKALTDDSKKELSDANAVIVSQKAQLGDADKACNSKLDVLRGQARKSKFKWFLAGAGTVVVFVISHAAGL